MQGACGDAGGWWSLHDLAGRDGDKLEGDLGGGEHILLALLDVGEDERGAAGRDQAVRRGRGVGAGHHRAAPTARVRALLVLVCLDVLGQVVAAHEALGTFGTDKLLLSCRQSGGRIIRQIRGLFCINVLQTEGGGGVGNTPPGA